MNKYLVYKVGTLKALMEKKIENGLRVDQQKHT